MFIGSKKIEGEFLEVDEENIKLEFNDNTSVVINKKLFDLIKSEEEGEGTITDNINHYFATKFLAELSMYGLGYYFVSNIATRVQVLAHNLREALIRKTFSCTGTNDINLKLITEINIDETVDNKK